VVYKAVLFLPRRALTESALDQTGWIGQVGMIFRRRSSRNDVFESVLECLLSVYEKEHEYRKPEDRHGVNVMPVERVE
jgi:hypothetical protein